MKCNNRGHEQQIIEYLCINQNCKQPSICCNLCLKKFHPNHINECLKIDQLQTFIKNNIIKKQDNWIEIIMIIKNLLQEDFIRQVQGIEDIFENNFLQDQDLYSFQFTHLRKQQILQFIKIENLIQKGAEEICEMISKMKDQISLSFLHIYQVQVQIFELLAFIQRTEQNQSHYDVSLQQQNSKESNNQKQNEQQQKQQKKIIFLDSDDSDSEEDIDQKSIEESQNNINQQKVLHKSNYFQLIEEKEFQKLIDFPTYQELLQSLAISKKLFTDKSTNNEYFYCQMNIQRISDLKNLDFSIFSNPCGFNSSILEQSLNNTLQQQDYFDSLMYYLIQFCPFKLKELFITKQINYQGIYAIYMIQKYSKKRGEVRIQIVDDKIPIGKQCKYNCLNILKKAIAKYYGGYDFFNVFTYYETLNSLFFVPIISIKYNNENFIDTLEKEIIANSFILFTLHSQNNNEFSKIIQILGIIYIRNVFDEQVLLIKLKSAYGRNIYKGEWGFQSPLWTDDLLNFVNYSLEDDGIFYMDYFSLIQQSQIFYCWRINQKEIISEQIILRRNQSSYMKVDMHQDDNLAIGIFLEDDIEKSRNLYFQIIMAELTEDSYNLYNLKFIKYNCYFELFLKKGAYIIFLKNPYIKQSITATISIFGSNTLQLTQIQKIEGFKQQIFQNQIIKSGKELIYSNVQLRKLDYSEFGWKIFQFVNISQIQIYELELNIPESNNIQFCKPFTNYNINQILKYNEPLLIIVKIYNEKFDQIKIYLNNDEIDF